MFRSTILTIALLATATQAINLRQETKADIGTSDSPSTNEDPTATWAFTKTGNLDLVDTLLEHSADGENAKPAVTPATPAVTPATPDVAPTTDDAAPETPDAAPTTAQIEADSDSDDAAPEEKPKA